MTTLYQNKPKKAKTHANTGKLSPAMQDFLKVYQNAIGTKKNTTENVVEVHNFLGVVARVYEKVRTTVEYKGEHVLRRNAIERIAKRLLWEKGVLFNNADSKQIAKSLIRELIWAGYIQNNSVPETTLADVQKVIEKYKTIIHLLSQTKTSIAKTIREDWLIGVVSSEIEDILDPTYRELFVKLFYRWFRERYEWQEENLDTHEKALQIYLAIHRAYQRSDEAIMRYHLLLLEYPNWLTAKEKDLEKFVTDFPRLYREIEKHLQFEGRLALYRIVKRHVPAFEVLQLTFKRNSEGVVKLLEQKNAFENEVRELCGETYKETRLKVNRGIARSVMYIFISKVVFALLLEIPYEIFRYQELRLLPISFNIIMPPLLMVAIGASIKPPGEKNTQTLLSQVKRIVYEAPSEKPIQFVVNKTRNSWSKLFGVIYFVLALLLFSGIALILSEFQFTVLGIMIFFAFLSLVLLFAFRVKANANKLRVVPENETLVDHVTNFLTLPFINLGFILSKGLSVINVASVILDFLIEAPLKSIIEVIEEWITYLREKREEVINVPE